MKESSLNGSAYFALCHGVKVRMSVIEKETPYVKPALNTLMKEGKLIGQHIFEAKPNGDITGDIILFLAIDNNELR